MDEVFLRGDGKYAVPIVGESYRQEALHEICRGLTERKKVIATLILEDQNPHDSNAVRVEIDGNKVGYLSREMAMIYRQCIGDAGHARAVGTCDALVEPPDSDAAPPPRLLDRFYSGDIYEVFLDLFHEKEMEGILKELAKRAVQVTFDPVPDIQFAGTRFCLTGMFSRPKGQLEVAIVSRGGTIAENVSKKIRYLVVGHAGSPEWKFGTSGTKVEKAMHINEEGGCLSIISEDQLLTSLGEAP